MASRKSIRVNMKAGLIGCGFIGKVIAQYLAKGDIGISLDIVYDKNRYKIEEICNYLDRKPIFAKSADDIINSNIDLVIEAASIQAVELFTLDILSSGKSMLIMSVGAFADREFYNKVKDIADKKGVKVYLPSGAIGGLDALKSASMEKLFEVSITSIKNPEGFKDSPHFIENKIDWKRIKERETLFEGNASDAVKLFPGNVNVSAVLSLSGVGSERTKVTVMADPRIDKNIHEIKVKGEFGEFEFIIKNKAFPENPKTSYIAALSAIATLKEITSSIKVG